MKTNQFGETRALRGVLLIISTFLFQFAPSFSLCADAQDADRPPNIVFILADDLGYGDLGCYGARDIATPNIDALAEEGLRFTSFYANSPVCTPSRAGLLTGRYPIRSGLTRVLWPMSRSGIEPREVTIAEVLRARNYATACIGKWHLGSLDPHLPRNHGFDYFFGLPYSNDMTKRFMGHPGTPLYRNEEVIERPAKLETLTQRYTSEAIHFIEENAEVPFFLYLSHTMPHTPLAVSEKFKGGSDRGLYGDVVEELDWSTGEIIKTLRRLEIERNTLVIFTSDNGPWLYQGALGGSGGGLRLGKGSTFEGGVRVPCIAWWPGVIEGGRTEETPSIMLDWFPTFAGFARAPVPDDLTLDGANLSRLLMGTGPRPDKALFFFRMEELQAYRSGPWKLKRPFNGRIYFEKLEHSWLLFNVEDDPSEETNVIDRYPEIAEKMKAEMIAFEAQFDSSPSPKF